MTTPVVAVSSCWTSVDGVNGHHSPTNTGNTELKHILDTIEVPIVVVRNDSTIGCFNKAAAYVFDLSTADIGRPCRDTPVFAGLRHLEQQCSEALESGTESRVDFRDGDRWFVVRVSPLQGDHAVTGSVLTFTNVTAFRASIDHAIYERECTKAILNTVAEPLVVLSTDQRIQSGNRAFYNMFGVSRDETQKVPLYEIASGALANFGQTLTAMLAGTQPFAPVELDQVITPKGQLTLIVDARPLALPGHSQRRVLITFQDITARKHAEAAKDLRSEKELRRSEAFLAEAQRLSSTGSFSWGVATDEFIWSEQLYRIYEFDRDLPITLGLIRTRIHPDDLSLFEKIVEQARGGNDFEWQYRLRMPDGAVKYMHTVAHATRDQDGQVEYIAAVQDVTQRRLSEEALAKARSELAHVSRVTTLGTLTASIAHEVNQPLSGIITNAGTCMRMLDANPPNIDGARETVQRTIRDSRRASDVITRLRTLFSKKDGATESVDLNEATREVIALSLSDLQRNRVVVRSEFADGLPLVTGDRVQLQQVIFNLLRNASDAMSSVDERPRQLWIRTERHEDDTVCLSVEDTGIGLAVESVNKIFDAFYTTKTDGMGIGLSVSRSIIENHHGRLWATANDGPGATFFFTIPCSRQTNTKVS